MKLPFIQQPSFQQRIALFFVGLLMAVLLTSFYYIRGAITQTAQNTLREELQIGARVFRRLLDQNSQQLVEATRVLTYDFGFREAIATRDRDTILSALTNHSARIRASGMAVIGLDGVVVALSAVEANAGRPYHDPELIRRAGAAGRASGIRLVDGKPYQVIVVPVLAPVPIAWVSMTFVIDDRSARDLERLSSSDVTFVQMKGDQAVPHATTLVPARSQDLLMQAARVIALGRDGMTVSMGGEDYEALAMPLEEGQLRLYVILQRSVAPGLAPYRWLEVTLMLVAAAALAITLIGAHRIARRATRPVAQLAEAAHGIAEGDYTIRVHSDARDEIGELTRAFSGMVKGLAERDSMRDALGKVASAEVMTRLLSGQIELGGEEREVTVIFTDIRNFTSLCETLSPQQSLQLLNEFLTTISEVIEGREGVVDKYLGDGVMAIFGAPVTRETDAQRALEATLEIRTRVLALGPTLAARGLPHPEVGVGINTASVIAGNMGSPTRLNYTVLGDGVNLAARLEGLTKRYHVPIVAGSRTRERVQGFVWRELDKVRVRGKTVAERIYEPLGREGEVPAAELANLRRWHEAIELFRGRQWTRARALFESLADERGYVRMVSIYTGYLRDLASQLPGDDWDGAFTLYEK